MMTDHEQHEADATAQVPALIKKAHTQLTEYLQQGAHVLCPLEVTNPPPGFIPRVVAVHISSNPLDKEVYVIQKGYEGFNGRPGRPDALEFTKIGVLKLCDMLGVSWDDEKSRRIDDGKDPMEIVYKAVGYRIDYQGRRQQIEGIFCVNLDAIRDEMINNKTEMAKSYMAKRQTPAEWNKVPAKWKKAIEDNQVAELIESETRAEMLKKRLKRYELAETGAKLRAVRSKGFRTTYTAKELEKDFVDIRMVELGGTPEALNKAGMAFKQMFGEPKRQEPEEPQRPEDVVIDAKANQDAKPDPMSKESIMADFQCCDQEQACELLVDIAEKKAFPIDPYKLQEMSESAMRNLLSTLLDMPEAERGKK